MMPENRTLIECQIYRTRFAVEYDLHHPTEHTIHHVYHIVPTHYT